MKISSLHSREILDSRGIPTLETVLELSDKTYAKASVPSGTSSGTSEAVELRDADPTRYNGNGVLKAVENVNTVIAKAIVGENFDTLDQLDDTLIRLDGTENKSKLGANAILSVSMAFCRASAEAQNIPLYKYFQELTGTKDLEAPQLNLLLMEGGTHGDWSTDFQEYMIIPRNEMFPTVTESLQAGAEVFHAIHDILTEKHYSTGVGYEGAYTPREITSNTEAFEIMLAGIEKAGYTPQEEILLGIDAAASEFYSGGTYNLRRENKRMTTEEWIALQAEWFKRYPIWSIEDTLYEEDWDGWVKLTSLLGNDFQIIGDDLFTTNTKRIQNGITLKAANCVLIKINQIGTVSETLDAIELADSAGYTTMISHRSGETNDDFIADLVMGTSCWQTKFGGPDRGERLAKYNRLLEIEHEVNR